MSRRWMIATAVFALAFVSFPLATLRAVEEGIPGGGPASEDTTAADMALIKSRLRTNYLAIHTAHAQEYLASQNPDGSWPGIDYASTVRASWPPLQHLWKIKELVVAFRTPGGPLEGSPPARQAIIKGLEFWFARKPTSLNWWNNEIGAQRELEPILLLMEGELPPTLMETGTAAFIAPVLNGKDAATGQNLVWFATEQLVRGLLRRDHADVAAAVDALSGAIVRTNGEGIQPDNSFHQHGPQLYNGGYGLGFLEDNIHYAALLAGTRYAFAPDKIDLLSDYLLRGTRCMLRGPWLDFSATGREISRPRSPRPAARLAPLCATMAQLRPEKKELYDALRAHLDGTGEPYSFLGNRYFWNSEFMTHQREGFYASVKVNSKYTTGTESMNGENTQGRWLPFGLTWMVRRGDEYAGLPPVLDWTHLPGVTSPEALEPMTVFVKQQGTFAGAATDGKFGVAGMKLEIGTETQSLTAHKAWFFFEDEIVALGAGITSTLATPVSTTVNQSRLIGEVFADGKPVAEGRHELSDVSWVWHDGTGYFFPEKANVILRTETQTGSWKAINTEQSADPVSEKVFSLWLPHGATPSGASYYYVIVPGIDLGPFDVYRTRPPVQLVANSPLVQAVYHNTLHLLAAVFYAPGQVTADGLTIEVDQPCFVLCKLTNGGPAQVTVSSPLEKKPLRVVLRNGGGLRTVNFDLPSGGLRGSSRIKAVTLPALQ